jgi:hypothetical protein
VAPHRPRWFGLDDPQMRARLEVSPHQLGGSRLRPRSSACRGRGKIRRSCARDARSSQLAHIRATRRINAFRRSLPDTHRMASGSTSVIPDGRPWLPA